MRTESAQLRNRACALPGIRSAIESLAINEAADRRNALRAKYFSADEMPAIAGMPDRTVAGFIAAKCAVVKLLKQRCGPADIRIMRTLQGGLSVQAPVAGNRRICVSVAHTRGAAYALACMETPR